MNKTEQLGFKWLKKQGYKNNDIKFNVNKSPDFICSDGRRYEVKSLQKFNRIDFQTSQTKKLKNSDTILVFDEKRLVKEFLWKDRKKQKFHFNILNTEDKSSISLPKSTKEALKGLRLYERESYAEMLSRLFKKELQQLRKKKEQAKNLKSHHSPVKLF